MSHLLTIVMAAAEEGEESSKALFYATGALLAVFAVVISAIGISRRETFPPSLGVARGIMALAALLVLVVMASAILTS